MSSYNKLADLEELLYKIPDATIRAYASDAIACYSAGANRSAIVSIWIAVIYDLYQKVRYLAEQFGDKAAIECIKEIDKIRSDSDKRKTGTWEEKIFEDSYKEIKMLTDIEYRHLDRIRVDRHSCAHPALNDEGLLFQPTNELVRTHIRTAIEALLSQPALIGKALTEALVRDVEGAYFPNDLEGVAKALEGRHLPASEKYRIALLFKSLDKVLWDAPEDSTIIERYSLVFTHLVRKYPMDFEAIERVKWQRIFDKVLNTRLPNLIELLNGVDDLWNVISNSLKTKVEQFLKTDATLNLKIQALNFLPELEDSIFLTYKELLNTTSISAFDKPREFIRLFLREVKRGRALTLTDRLIRYNIELFSKSKSFEGGRVRATELIKPFISFFTANHVSYLLEQSHKGQEDNKINQLVDCAFLLENLFTETIQKFPQTLSDWESFIHQYTKKTSIGEIYYVWSDLGILVQKIEEFKVSDYN